MPIYEYRCEQGHTFDVMQRMSDDPVQTCTTCDAPVHRVFHPVAVHFKGSGFYNTDYGTRKRAREKEASASESKASDGAAAKSDAGSGSSDSAKSDGAKSSTDSKKSEPKASAA